MCLYNCICIYLVFLRDLYFRRIHVFSSVSGSAARPRLTSAATQPLKDSDIDDDDDDDEDDDDDVDDKDAIQWSPPNLVYDYDLNIYDNDLNSYWWFKMMRIAPILIMVTVILSCYHDDDDELKRNFADNDVDQKSSHCSISK